MGSIKSIIRNILVFIILFVITFIIIFHSYDFNQTINIVLEANGYYILLAILCMVLYFVFEGINTKMILYSLGKKAKIINTIKYSLIGFFFSGITPAATGGQPMQIYYMNKDGIPVDSSTLSLMVQLVSFQIVTIAMGVFGALFNTELLKDGFIWIFLIGAFIKCIGLAIMMIGIFYKKFSKKLIALIIKILKIFNYKNVSEKEKEFNE